jgi:hypothetical protein
MIARIAHLSQFQKGGKVMAVTGVSEHEYRNFLENGGDLTFEIDAKDIDASGDFEKSPLIEPFLITGFQLQPTPLVNDPKERATLFFYGGSWTKVVVHTYANKGSIIYRKLSSGRYEAKVSVPSKRASHESAAG